MSDLPKIQQELREALPQKGISYLIKSLKGLLPEGTPKYDIVIALEAEYRQLKLDTFGGILSPEDKTLRESQLRKRILDLVSSLEAADFDIDTEHSILGDKQKIRRGHILYRIPQKMQLQEESRCLVRIAFDKAMIVEELDLHEDIELRSEVRISDYMKVEIEDPSADGVFAIRTTSEEVQFIDEDDFTEWHFYVKPLVPGEHSLELKVSVILRINDEDRIREKTLEESVVVITESLTEQDEDQTFSQIEEAFVVGDASEVPGIVMEDVPETLASAPRSSTLVVPQVIQPAPVIVDSVMPPPPAAAVAPRKSKINVLRNLSLVLVLVLGFGFAFNLLTDDNNPIDDVRYGDIIYDDDDSSGESPSKSDVDLLNEELIEGNWQIAAVDIVQDSTVISATDMDPSFAALVGGTFLFRNDSTALLTLVNGYYESINYIVNGDEISLITPGFDKGEINYLNEEQLVYTLPLTNDLGTFYVRYTLYKLD